MRKKLKTRKLTLRTETLRKLVDSELDRVAGACGKGLTDVLIYCSTLTNTKCLGSCDIQF